jgi:hypothetical protein
MQDLNGLAGTGDAVPTWRSSPPAEKWAVCIGRIAPSQGKAQQKVRCRNDISAVVRRGRERTRNEIARRGGIRFNPTPSSEFAAVEIYASSRDIG